jgi:hypothetical protein
MPYGNSRSSSAPVQPKPPAVQQDQSPSPQVGQKPGKRKGVPKKREKPQRGVVKPHSYEELDFPLEDETDDFDPLETFDLEDYRPPQRKQRHYGPPLVDDYRPSDRKSRRKKQTEEFSPIVPSPPPKPKLHAHSIPLGSGQDLDFDELEDDVPEAQEEVEEIDGFLMFITSDFQPPRRKNRSTELDDLLLPPQSTVLSSSPSMPAGKPSKKKGRPTGALPPAAFIERKSKKEKPDKDQTGFIAHIVNAIKSLGGKATGHDITSWIAQTYPEVCFGDHKILSYRVNAVLSSKKHTILFNKRKIDIDNNKKASLWSLRDGASNFEELMNQVAKTENESDSDDYDKYVAAYGSSDQESTDSDQEGVLHYEVIYK